MKCKLNQFIHNFKILPVSEKLKNMNKLFLTFLCILLLLPGLSTKVMAQANWEVDLVRNINPRYPDNTTWKAFSASAKPLAVAVPMIMFAAGLVDHVSSFRHNAFEMVAGLAITTIVTEGLKIMVKRPRPYETYTDIYPDVIDAGQSFPSGHVSVAFSTATSLALVTKKWYVTVPAFAWAAGVGYSRMYFGQHYPSDVVAGAVIGAAGAYAAHWLNKKYFHRHSLPATSL